MLNRPLRLFCFPYAGGSSTIFRPWARLLPPTLTLCPVALPGRAERFAEPAAADLSSLLARLAPELLPNLEPPYAFFGHSMGAVIAFELTRYLRQLGHPLPERLIVSGRRAPHVPDPDPPVHGLPDPEFIAELKRLNGTPTELLESPDLLTLVLPTLRADFALCETYVHTVEPPLPCPITAYGGLWDKDTSRTMLQAWAEQTTGAFQLRMFPGDHFFLNTQQALLIEALSRDLATCLPLG